MVKGWPEARTWLMQLKGIEAYLVYSTATGEMKVWKTQGFLSYSPS
jgi:hypothetical protein